MLGQPQHLVERVGALRRGLEREPFVEHQRIVVEARRRKRRAPPAAPARRATPARRARPGGRSCCRRASNCALASAAACAGVGRGEQAERDGAQPAHALGARRQVVAGGAVAAMRGEQGRRPARCRSPRAALRATAWIASGSTTSIRSAIRLSLGSRIASALNAGSSELDWSVARDRADDRRRIDRARRARRRSARASSAPASPRSARTDRCRPAPAARARPAARSASIDHRRREIAVDRQQRRFGDIVERDALLRLVEQDQPLGRDLGAALLADQRGPAAGSASAACPAAPASASTCCSRCSVALPAAGVMLEPRLTLRRARLAVPDLERRTDRRRSRPRAP